MLDLGPGLLLDGRGDAAKEASVCLEKTRGIAATMRSYLETQHSYILATMYLVIVNLGSELKNIPRLHPKLLRGIWNQLQGVNPIRKVASPSEPMSGSSPLGMPLKEYPRDNQRAQVIKRILDVGRGAYFFLNLSS